VCETGNRRVGRDAAGPDLFSSFFKDRKWSIGFLRARTLSQKTGCSERIYRLVFSASGVYTIGQCVRIFILPNHYKKTGGSFLISVLGK
jgi:hypothetical protein